MSTQAVQMADTAQASMLDWALAYARNGEPVFPCNEHPGDFAKAPRLSKREGGRGHLDATTDAKQICDWWIRWPNALLGRPVPKHLVCLDLDPRKGGTTRALKKAFGELPPTEFVISGRGDGGVHLFYQRPLGPITGSDLNKICPGVDIKLDTGYTIIPPSLHPDTGKPYAWGGPFEHAPLPENIRKVLQPVRILQPRTPGVPNAKALEGILRRVATEAKTRNKVLYWGAQRLVENGYPETAFNALAGAAAHAGLRHSEITKNINSAIKGTS
jgi:hypothetical protein